MEKIYRTAKYIRTSTVDDEQELRNSCENQSKLIDNFLRCHPTIKLVSEKIDNGFSGLFFERAEFQRMFHDAETRKINCIIVKNLSRLGRNVIDTGYYAEIIFPKLCICLISINDGYDSANGQGNFSMPLN